MGVSPKAHLLASLIEHESCVSLTSQRCWDPTSKLKTAREEGAGFFQITRAYNKTGSLRFDALAELKAKHYPDLYELNWLNIYERPDLQAKAGILKVRDHFNYYSKYTSNIDDVLAFTDASYNGGISGLDNERRACYISSGCDASKWFGNVENFCLKSKAALYGNRSACDINRHHVKDVLLIRAAKYKQLYDMIVPVSVTNKSPAK